MQRGGVAIAPDDSLKILEMKDQFTGKWVLITEAGKYGKRQDRRGGKPFLEKVLEEAGALGSIQRVPVPMTIINVRVDSWERLPTLPDIRLQDSQYDEIKALAQTGEAVELEFEIRNWFKMGPVKYHNVVAWIPGTECPDEYLILSGHLDAFDGGTGAVDCGSGVTPAMEAMRLLALAGAKPRRTVMAILFAGEEAGILGAQAWVRQNPSKLGKIGALINRDYTPGAVTGVSVPPSWKADFEKVTRPLVGLSERFPFEGVEVNPYPSVRSVRPGGTDASAFSMVGVPTLRLKEETDYSYRRAWHTLFDTYNEVVPYAEHQGHTALSLAVMAYGLGNLDHMLSREDFYLSEGLYADISTTHGRMIAELDYENAPKTVQSFVQLFDNRDAAGGGWWRRLPAIGVFEGAFPMGTVTQEAVKQHAVKKLKSEKNGALSHNQAGILGMAGPGRFYVTAKKSANLDKQFTAIGKVIAGVEVPKPLSRAIRFSRFASSAWGTRPRPSASESFLVNDSFSRRPARDGVFFMKACIQSSLSVT